MAGITPAVNSAFGNGPNNVNNPTASADSTLSREQWMAQNPGKNPDQLVPGGNVDVSMTPPPDAQTPPNGGNTGQLQQVAAGQQPDSDIDSFMDSLNDDSSSSLDQESSMPPPTGLDSIKEQLREAGTRLKNAFTVAGAAGPQESMQVLKQSGLFEDVRIKDGEVQVKRPGRGGWEPFDRPQFEMIGDVIDNARNVFEAVIDRGIQAGAIAAGTLVEPGAGTVLGFAGGASGALAAKKAGDFVAQQLMGIPRDQTRNEGMEDATTAALGAAFGGLSGSLANRAAARAAQATAGKQTLDFATQQAANAIQDIQEVKNSGIVLGPNGKFRLDPQQIVGAGNIPELDATAQQLSQEPEFRNFRRQVGDSIENAYNSVARSLGAQAGKGAALGDEFQLTAKDVRQVEGKLIGSFRQMADERLAGAPQVAPRFTQTVQSMMQDMPASIDDFALSAGLPNEKAGQLATLLKGYSKRISGDSGAFTVDEMGQLTKQLNQIVNSPGNLKSGLSAKLFDLRDAIRDDWSDAMGEVLPKSYQGVYQQSLARYRQIMQSTKTLGKLIETEGISENELLSRLFEQKGSYKFAQSAKTLIQETDPQLWDNLSAKFFTKLKQDATNPVTNTVNWGQVAKKWEGMDSRMRTDLLEGLKIPSSGMSALIRLGTRYQNATFDALAKPAESHILARDLRGIIITFAGGGAAAKGGVAGSLVEGMGRNQSVAKWMQEGGLEEVLKGLPGLKPSIIQNLRAWAANFTPNAVQQVGNAVEPAATATIRRAAAVGRKQVKTKVMEKLQ